MPDNLLNVVTPEEYARMVQTRDKWDMNAKTEEWRKRYINEWADEGTYSTSAATYATYSPSISAPVRIVTKDGKLCLEWVVEEEDNEPKGWETL